MLRNSLLVMCMCFVLASVDCARRRPAAAPTPPPMPPASAPPPAPPASPPPTTSSSPAAAPVPPVLTEDQIFQGKSLEQLNAERPLGDVFFDYDAAVLRDDARAPLQRNAEWLRRWTSTQITIEGHCDSRGSSEYNIALGDRRAAAVKEYLLTLGIPPERVLTVSKGKEQPFCREENESCWQQNRRGHFVITRK